MGQRQFEDNIALDRQIRLILSTFQNVTVNDNYYQFRCNVCGDSKKSKSKKRAYILKNKQPYMMYCHNCFYNKPVFIWMKEFFPAYYKSYISEILTNKQKVKPLPKIENPKVKKRSPEKEYTKFFIPIKKGITPLFAKAIRTCIDRNIPESIWEKWYVSTGGMYHDRLIIPFYDDKNKIYNYQCRALYDNMSPKYLTRVGNHNCVYNYFNVNKMKPVVCFEGIIDSLFVENAVAICGANKKVDLSSFQSLYYCLDNDETGKQRSIDLLIRSEKVFLWNKFIKENNFPNVKDLNELCVKINKPNFSFKELEKYFTNSIYDKVYLV
jgi:hypothetical protein